MNQQDLLDICRNSILSLMLNRNIHISQLAREVNVPQPTMHRLLKGKSSDIKLSVLIEIANFFSVSLADLTNYAPPCTTRNISHIPACRYVPVLTWKEACDVSRPTFNDQREYVCAGDNCSVNTYALKVKASFNFTSSKNSIFIVDPDTLPEDGDYVIVNYQNANEATVRMLVIDGPVAELKKINSEDSADILTDETIILGTVLQTVTSHKKIQSNAKVVGVKNV